MAGEGRTWAEEICGVAERGGLFGGEGAGFQVVLELGAAGGEGGPGGGVELEDEDGAGDEAGEGVGAEEPVGEVFEAGVVSDEGEVGEGVGGFLDDFQEGGDGGFVDAGFVLDEVVGVAHALGEESGGVEGAGGGAAEDEVWGPEEVVGEVVADAGGVCLAARVEGAGEVAEGGIVVAGFGVTDEGEGALHGGGRFSLGL